MEIDEIQLTEFFGVPPVAEDPEEKEFFRSSTFIFERDGHMLYVHFGANHGDMMVRLCISGHTEPVVKCSLTDITKVAVDDSNKILIVLGKTRDARGNDPDVRQRIAISLEPLTIGISD